MALDDLSNLGGSVASGFTSGGVYVEHVASKETLPDLTLRYIGKAENLSYGTSSLLRQLEVDDGTQSDSVLGWGINLEAEYRVTPAVTLRGGIAHGILKKRLEPPAFFDPISDSVEPITLTGVPRVAGPEHINFGYGYAAADLDDAIDAGVANANETFTDLHLNLYLVADAECQLWPGSKPSDPRNCQRR